jgi:hypothetical protein
MLALTTNNSTFTLTLKKALNLQIIFLAGLRLGLKNPQVGEKWVSDDGSYFMQRSLLLKRFQFLIEQFPFIVVAELAL